MLPPLPMATMHAHFLLPLSPLPIPNSRHFTKKQLPFFSFPPTTALTPRHSVVRALAEVRQDEVVVGGAESTGKGPIELPPSSSSSTSTIFATSDDPSPLQVSTSVLLTGAISIFLFRALRRRAKRAKELRVRSTGVKGVKDVKEEALESLKAMTSASLDAGKQPSPVQTFLGALAAGAVAFILYKFTTTIEASLNHQAIPDGFSARQITITIRTIVNGLCYLATFVFGINSIGLMLYSGQLAINSIMEPDSSNSPPSMKKSEGFERAASSATSSDDVDVGNKEEES